MIHQWNNALLKVMATCCAILEAAQAAITFNRALFLTCYGAEFIAKKVRTWIGAVGTKTAFIAPGSPWENTHEYPCMISLDIHGRPWSHKKVVGCKGGSRNVEGC